MSYRYNINFINESGLPVLVESWLRNKLGSSSLQAQCVMPNQTVKLESTTGEWYLNCMFTDDTLRSEWTKQNHQMLTLGKFRSEPCMSGNYSWMECKEFNAIYKDGTIHFVKT